jgi:hypothetical protein
MASESGGNSALAFIVGGLLVLVLVIGAFVMLGGGNFMGGGEPKSVDVNIHAPKIAEAPSLPAAE